MSTKAPEFIELTLEPVGSTSDGDINVQPKVVFRPERMLVPSNLALDLHIADRDELNVLGASRRRWKCRRSGGQWQGVLYAPDGKTESLVTPGHSTVGEAIVDLADRWTEFEAILKHGEE